MGGRIVAPDGRIVAHSVRRVSGRRDKARGLLGRPPLCSGEALLIEKVRQVHTFGMRYPIDVLFCDAEGRVVHAVVGMVPGRVTRWVRGAAYVIELPAGEGVARGTMLRVDD